MASDGGGKTIAELINTLPEEERLILTLHLVNMISTAEIAEKLGVPERAVVSVNCIGQIAPNCVDFIRIFIWISHLQVYEG